MSLKITKNRTQPIKILGKDKSLNKDFAMTTVKTLAEILSLDKKINVTEEYFLQTYKDEDRNFLKKKSYNDNSTNTNKGNCNQIHIFIFLFILIGNK